MDISGIVKILSKNQRNFVSTFLIHFPLSYTELWMVMPSFKDLDLIPSVIFSMCLSIVSIYIALLTYILTFADIDTNISPGALLTPFVVTLFETLLWVMRGKDSDYIITSSIVIFFCVVITIPVFYHCSCIVNNFKNRHKNE